MSLRARVLLAGVVVALLWPASQASAGGWFVSWELDRPAYRPGETATASTDISWRDAGSSPADGPFYAYLASADPLPESVPWPGIPADAVFLGEITVTPGDKPAKSSAHARITFEIPEVADGFYGLWHCNDPCTTSLANIGSGAVVISRAVSTASTTSARVSTPPTTRRTTTTTTTTTSPVVELTADDREPTESSSSLVSTPVALGALAALSGTGVWALWQRHRREP